MKTIRLAVGVLAVLLSGLAFAEGVDFIQPKDGDTVTSTFTAKFSVDG